MKECNDRSRERVTGCFATKIVLGEKKETETARGGRGPLYEWGDWPLEISSHSIAKKIKKRGDSKLKVGPESLYWVLVPPLIYTASCHVPWT